MDKKHFDNCRSGLKKITLACSSDDLSRKMDALLQIMSELREVVIDLRERVYALKNNQEALCSSQGILILQNKDQKAEIMAQNLLLQEFKMSIKNVEQAVCHMTGEVSD